MEKMNVRLEERRKRRKEKENGFKERTVCADARKSGGVQIETKI